MCEQKVQTQIRLLLEVQSSLIRVFSVCNAHCIFLKCNSVVFVVKPLCSNLSLVVRKPAFCICENKDADQLRGNREAYQCLFFRYTDSTIPLLPKSEISSL